MGTINSTSEQKIAQLQKRVELNENIIKQNKFLLLEAQKMLEARIAEIEEAKAKEEPKKRGRKKSTEKVAPKSDRPKTVEKPVEEVKVETPASPVVESTAGIRRVVRRYTGNER